MAEMGERAVVMGAGLAGLLTARVLSEFYPNVTLVERDRLGEEPAQRKGVPQARHLHSLLSRGSAALEELFPGVLGELAAAGAHVLDEGDLSRVDFRFGSYGFNRRAKFAEPGALVQYLASRPLVESHLRRRVRALGNVQFLDGHDVLEPIAAEPRRVVGVGVANRSTGRRTLLAADLVVDAMGRATHTPAFLQALGHSRPPQQLSASQPTYYSQLIGMPADTITERLVLTRAAHATGGLVAYENGTWMLTVTRADDSGDPPADLAALRVLAEPLLTPSVSAALRTAEPLGGVAVFRHAGGIWRRYDELVTFPEGLLVVGDALCTLNPIWGQGMTLTALQALLLRDCLSQGRAHLAARFFDSAATAIGPIWAMNQAREAPAPRTDSVSRRMVGWLTEQAFRAARHDIVLTERLVRTAHLVDPPGRLREPAVLARVLTQCVKRNATVRARHARRLARRAA
jgi:2-polyprenyl-6-methoxyphenol hydroxylase-like FAD-dependent oxidoreductase